MVFFFLVLSLLFVKLICLLFAVAIDSGFFFIRVHRAYMGFVCFLIVSSFSILFLISSFSCFYAVIESERDVFLFVAAFFFRFARIPFFLSVLCRVLFFYYAPTYLFARNVFSVFAPEV